MLGIQLSCAKTVEAIKMLSGRGGGDSCESKEPKEPCIRWKLRNRVLDIRWKSRSPMGRLVVARCNVSMYGECACPVHVADECICHYEG